MKRITEDVNFWRVQDLNNLELMQATYTHHFFPRHSHETFGIGVVERGCIKTFQHGTNHTIAALRLVLFNPNEVHE